MAPRRSTAAPSTHRPHGGLRLVIGVLLGLAVLGLPVLVTVDTARAATYTQDCGDDPGTIPPEITNDAAIEVHALNRARYHDCRAITERLELVEADLAGLADATTDPTQPAQRVALSTSDRQRADLSWWGAWATVGLLLALLVVPRVMARFKFWDER
jgi:hypothetical protein